MSWFLKEKVGFETQRLKLRFETLAVSHLAEFTKESGTDLVCCAVGLPARQWTFLSLS